MRHGKKFMHLGRKTAHRKSMLANMSCSLVEHKRIKTTLTKAKALKKFFEPLLTKSKNDSTHNRRIVFKYLRNKYAVSELFREISKKIADRPGGYTRVIRLGNRLGDNAEMAMIELVDYNQTYSVVDKSKKKTRRRRAKKNKDSAINEMSAEEIPAKETLAKETPAKETPAEETPAEETPAKETPAEETPAENKESNNKKKK